MRYMLDTDICIYAINERPPAVLQALREHPRLGLEFPPDSFATDPRLAGMAWARPRAR